jgi:curved DNA-binding protein CbpA
LHEAARYGSYFDCLRIASDASTTEVREAYLRLTGDIESLRSEGGISPADIEALDEVAQVARDAFEVLSNPDLRLSYRRALAGD